MRALLVLALVGCDGSNDIVGPFTGTTHRFVVDRFSIPRDSSEAGALAADLNGDGTPDNKFGNVTGVLAGTSDLTPHAPEMIASGALASVVTIEADDLVDDPSVGVTFFGAEGDAATVAGGRFTAGAFISNRTHSTRAPGQARVHLPVYINADPIVLDLEGLEIELAPDGAGGYDAIVRGGFRHAVAREAAYLGLIQMFETEPDRHLVFGRGVDKDHDDVITREEVDDSVIALLLIPDIDLFDGDNYAPQVSTMADSLSVAFGVHLAPCDAGRCSTAQPAMLCRDRVRDGDETDVDCGGSCQPCWAAKTCRIAEDCQSRACDGGTCRAATCSDGVRDGYESDVDCGSSCGTCAAGRRCAADTDCASNNCDNGIASLGVCL